MGRILLRGQPGAAVNNEQVNGRGPMVQENFKMTEMSSILERQF